MPKCILASFTEFRSNLSDLLGKQGKELRSISCIETNVYKDIDRYVQIPTYVTNVRGEAKDVLGTSKFGNLRDK